MLYLDKLERADRAVSRRGARRRDGRLLSAVRVRREPRRGLDRHAAARVPAVPARRSPASRLGDRAGGERQRRDEAGGVQPQVRPADHLGPMAAARFRARADAEARGRERRPGATASSSAATGCSPGATRSASAMSTASRTIDQMGEFIEEHARRAGKPAFGGPAVTGRSPTAKRPSPSSCRTCAASSRRTAA